MIGLLGLDHRRASVAARGRLSFTGERLRAALTALAADTAIDEVAILSTCNRTEVYLATREWEVAQAVARRFLVPGAGGGGVGGGDRIEGPVHVDASLPLAGRTEADGRDAADGARVARGRAGGKAGSIEVTGSREGVPSFTRLRAGLRSRRPASRAVRLL